VDEAGRPLRVIITSGTVNDCTKADELTKGIEREALLGDKAFDTNEIVNRAIEAGVEVVIVVSIEIELPTALENAQLPAFSSLLQLISKRNDYIPPKANRTAQREYDKKLFIAIGTLLKTF